MNTLTRLLVLFALASASAAPAVAEVYKRTNPDGSVEFTDVPSKQEEEPVPLNPTNTFEAPSAPLQQSTPKPKASQEKYSAISITSPANEATIRDNTGAITVNVSLTPALQSGHKLVLLVDGSQKGESTSGSFELTNLDRGSHSLAAQVLDDAGKTVISSTAVTIFLHRQSVIKPKRFVK
jgi:hypothetical protein